MIWHKNAKKPNFEEKCRIEDCKFLGCVCSWINGIGWVFGEYHHLLSGNKRRGHMFGIALNSWYHRGVQDEGLSKTQMIDKYGPSLAHGSKPFHTYWGDDESLLEVQNAILKAYRESDEYQGNWRKR